MLMRDADRGPVVPDAPGLVQVVLGVPALVSVVPGAMSTIIMSTVIP